MARQQGTSTSCAARRAFASREGEREMSQIGNQFGLYRDTPYEEKKYLDNFFLRRAIAAEVTGKPFNRHGDQT